MMGLRRGDNSLHIGQLKRILRRLRIVVLRGWVRHGHWVRVIGHVLPLQHGRADLVDRQVATAVIGRDMVRLSNIIALRRHAYGRRPSVLRHRRHGGSHWRRGPDRIPLLNASLILAVRIIVVQRQGIRQGCHIVGAMATKECRGGCQGRLERRGLLLRGREIVVQILWVVVPSG